MPATLLNVHAAEVYLARFSRESEVCAGKVPVGRSTATTLYSRGPFTPRAAETRATVYGVINCDPAEYPDTLVGHAVLAVQLPLRASLRTRRFLLPYRYESTPPSPACQHLA